MGHEVIFLIGDFTSRIGDPTDKEAARIPQTREQVINNTKTWLNQVRQIIDIDNKENPVKVMYNHDWLSKMSFEDVLNLTSNFTVQQMLERDMFEKRMNENKPIYVHEFLYPIMQGYDSVAMNVDIELCGNDQKFNALCGRTLQKRYNNKDKFVFITTLLVNPKTGQKMMSKSLGTGVWLDATKEDMYGQVMAQPDENMRQLFIDCTWLSYAEIEEILKSDDNKAKKMRLAREIVSMYHSKEDAELAEKHWQNTFSEGKIPEDAPTIEFDDISLVDAFLRKEIVSSKSEFRRLVGENAIKTITEDGEEVVIKDDTAKLLQNTVYKIGKKRFLRIK